MSEDIISKKTRTAFRNFLGKWTLQEIMDEFEAAGIKCDKDYDPGLSGARKSLVERYYHSLDFSSPSDIRRLLAAYANILTTAVQQGRTATTIDEQTALAVTNMVGWLERDGFEFRGRQIVPVSQRVQAVLGQGAMDNGISEVTRRNIFDALRVDRVRWWGRLSETDFLERVFDLRAMPSSDPRFQIAEDDIWQHRERNDDWPDDWVFSDGRFDLLHCQDETFLRFLCEMLHPAVRGDGDEVRKLLTTFNDSLSADGWEIAERTRLSGRPVFAARRLLPGTREALAAAKTVAATLDSQYIHQQITRMEAAVYQDPEQAIGTAKEFVETICKTILDARTVAYSKEDDPPRLVKLVLKELQLVADEVPADDNVVKALRRMVGSLSGMAQGVAELRNLLGTGHGKSAWHGCAEPRHVRLAVGAATTLGVFLFEVYQEHRDASDGG